MRKSDNEEKSALLAIKRLKDLGISESNIQKCSNQILATKGHQISDDYDTNLFTDADLSILGKDEKTYQKYCEDIRREFKVFPTFIYRRGRKKVLNHFLSMERIYKTDIFYQQYEEQANRNLKRELLLM